jgi:hypothetical protein
LGGRRDSAAQISGQSPPSTSPPPTNRNRRRSSLAQLTDILREFTWSGTGTKRNQKPPLNRRETLADLARSLPWHRISNDQYTVQGQTQGHPAAKRRESSCDSGIRSLRSRRDSHSSEQQRNQDIPNFSITSDSTPIRNGSRRGSGDSNYQRSRRDSTQIGTPKLIGQKKTARRDSLAVEIPNFRMEQRPSTSSGESGPIYYPSSTQVDTSVQCIPMPTIITSSVTPPATSPTLAKTGRRDSTTQCSSRMNRRESRLQRQATAYDESCAPPWSSRRGSQPQQPALSPEGGPSGDSGSSERQARRDSLSPDINSASK